MSGVYVYSDLSSMLRADCTYTLILTKHRETATGDDPFPFVHPSYKMYEAIR